MLVKPVLPSITVMDADENNRVSFVIIGGSQFTGYEFEIRNNSDLSLITERVVVSSSTVIALESGLLENGTEYRLRVKTTWGDMESEFSDYIIIKCYETAIITIENLELEDNIYKIRNQRFIFEGKYYQPQSIGLKSFYYIIYDENGTVVRQFPTVFQQSGVLAQRVDIFENNRWYRIQLVCIDQNDMIYSSGIINFYVDYIPPRVRQILNLENNSEEAAVDINCDIKQLIFNHEGNVFFTENDEINLMDINSSIYMDELFNINQAFWLQLWITELRQGEDVEIMTLKQSPSNIENTFRLFYCKEDKKFHVRKTLGTIVMEYISEEFIPDNPFSLYIKQEEGRVDIIPELVVEE